MSETIVVVDYRPAWSVLFKEEKAHILAVIGNFLAEVHHIGSTSVPGLGAKPIIDIMAVIRDLPLVEHCVAPLEQLGYEYKGEYGMPGRHYFRKPAGITSPFERTHHIHMIEKRHEQYERWLLFRDYLRAHPETASMYHQLKKDLAQKFGADREEYTEAKTDFIMGIVAKARSEQIV